MTDKKMEDQQTGVETEEVMAEEFPQEELIVEEVIAAEINDADQPKKEGRFRGFFKTRKLAIGITVLVILLAANVTVLGSNMHFGKGGHRAHSGKTIEREYAQGQQGQGFERGERGERGERNGNSAQDSGKAFCGEKHVSEDAVE